MSLPQNIYDRGMPKQHVTAAVLAVTAAHNDTKRSTRPSTEEPSAVVSDSARRVGGKEKASSCEQEACEVGKVVNFGVKKMQNLPARCDTRKGPVWNGQAGHTCRGLQKCPREAEVR